MMKNRKFYLVLAAMIAVGTVALDQWTKQLARTYLDVGETLTPLYGFLELKLHMNDGASLGIFGGERWMLVAVSAIMAVAVAAYIFLMKSISRGEMITLSFVLGGAVGNLIDRAASGLVTDMLFFPWIGKIPLLPDFVCNIADIGIVLGMFAFVIFFFLADRKREAKKKRPTERAPMAWAVDPAADAAESEPTASTEAGAASEPAKPAQPAAPISEIEPSGGARPIGGGASDVAGGGAAGATNASHDSEADE